MSARVTWSGLSELVAALRALPVELTADARAIVIGEALDAHNAVETAYRAHAKTGNLADHMQFTVPDAGEFGVRAIVKNTAKHVFIYEHGTEARHTELGWNRGAVAKSTPPGRVFVPAMIQHRRVMYDDLKALLVAHGLTVSGEA